MTNRFQFQDFETTTAQAKRFDFVNTNNFSSATFRVSFDVADTLTFQVSVDMEPANRVSVKAFHIEANSFVSSVAAFTAGHFILSISGFASFGIVSALAGTLLTITGRAIRDGIGALGISGLNGGDGISVLDPLDGTSSAVSVVLRDAAFAAVVPTQGFPTLPGLSADGDTVINEPSGGATRWIHYQFRNVDDDALEYVNPEARPILVMDTPGAAVLALPLSYGFVIDISGVDFTDVIGLGFEAYCESDFDYQLFSGNVNPDTLARNYKRFTVSIRDSLDAIIWQAEKVDVPFGSAETAVVDQERVDFSFEGPNNPVTAGSWAATVSPAERIFSFIAVASWTAVNQAAQPRGMIDNTSNFQDNNTKYHKLEFCLQRLLVQDSMEGFYVSPRNYPLEGNANTVATTAGKLAWDFADATNIFITSDLTTGDGTDLAVDVDPMGQIPATGTAERQRLYFKNVFLRKRPYFYENYWPLGHGYVTALP